jgi:putative ABC transport system substrate-binding protein
MKVLQRLIVAALIFAATAAAAADKTVGVIMTGNLSYYQEIHKAFVGALTKEGFDHRKIDTLLQMPSPDMLSWTNAARKLAVAEVNVLVTYGGPAAVSAIKETKSIPIVYAAVYDPGSIGVSARNITGISSKVPLTSLLKYLRKLTSFTKVAVVYNESEPDSVRQADELAQLESQYGFESVRMPIKKTDEARKLVFTGKADVVFITLSAAANEALDAIVKSAHGSKIPTVSQTGGSGEKGVILSLAPSATEQGEAAARMAVRLLKGENPSSIAPEVPKLVELVLNLKEANAVGLKVPMDLVTDATRVIK